MKPLPPITYHAPLCGLTAEIQGRRAAAPWKIDDAPADFVDAMCRSIIGFEIRLTRIEGKWKLSQNRPLHDRLGVIDGLRAQGNASLKMAELVETASGGGDGDGED